MKGGGGSTAGGTGEGGTGEGSGAALGVGLNFTVKVLLGGFLGFSSIGGLGGRVFEGAGRTKGLAPAGTGLEVENRSLISVRLR